MRAFSDSQIEDLKDLQQAMKELRAEAVIIGAMAYRFFVDDVNRQTYDIDLAIAVDLNGIPQLEASLTALGWRQLEQQEQRWMTTRRNWMDLLPAGPALRRAGKLIWPRSGFVMSLVGFDHAFQDSTPQDVGGGLTYKVVPPAVFALLKIVAYGDDPQRRAKDLIDLRRLMQRYERDSDRIFSDEVFQAKLPDVEFTGAFLLGLDVKRIANRADAQLVESFIYKATKPWEAKPISPDDWAAHEESYFQHQLLAFTKGFKGRPGPL